MATTSSFLMRWWRGPFCTRPTHLVDFFIVSLKQQSTDRHVAPLWQIILIPSQPVFALSPSCCLLSRETTNINFIVLGFTWSGLTPMLDQTRGEQGTITPMMWFPVLEKQSIWTMYPIYKVFWLDNFGVGGTH
jgi:hypothetical protein